jgi:periplasmic protein TonB
MSFTRPVPTQSQRRDGSTLPRRDWRRPSESPATTIPGPREGRKTGTVVSLIVHALLLLLFLLPPALNTDPTLKEEALGGGGPGPAGGGGGGTSGTGGVRYVQLAPPPKPVPPPVPTPQPIVEPPKPIPEPVIPPLEMPKLAEQPKVEIKVQSPVIGIGGGTGTDGTTGNGPGVGGGVGSGIGTGRGSGVGPGTGGGGLENYPPSPTELFIPPMPVPSSVRGFHLIVNFDVDETGKIVGMPVFTPSKDGGYNRKLQDYLKTFKFRPGTTRDGKPIRARYQLIVDF